MIQAIQLIALLTFAQVSFAGYLCSQEKVLGEEVTYVYPFSYDDTEDEMEPASKSTESKKESPTARHAHIGTAQVTVDVKNMDALLSFPSDRETCQQNEKFKRKSPSKENKKSKKNSHFDEDKEDDKTESTSPEFNFSVKWGGTR